MGKAVLSGAFITIPEFSKMNCTILKQSALPPMPIEPDFTCMAYWEGARFNPITRLAKKPSRRAS